MTLDNPTQRPKHGRPTDPTAWKDRARSAMREHGRAKHGQREAVLLTVGNGANSNTVRREIKALAFLDELEKSNPGLYHQLQTFPFNSIEILARWHDFDPRGTVEAARKLGSGEHSSSSLQSAMRLAKTEYRGPSRKDLPTCLRSSIERGIKKIWGATALVTELPLPQPNKPPIDILFSITHANGRSERVGGLIVGPYRNAETYSKRRQEELLRALGTAWMFDHVVVLLPSAGDLTAYEHTLAQYVDAVAAAVDHVRSPHVHIIRVDDF